MEVKVFEGSSMKDVVRLVKTEFGQNAVILRTDSENVTPHQQVFRVTAARAAESSSSQTSRGGASSLGDLDISFIKQMQQLEGRMHALESNSVSRGDISQLADSVEELKYVISSFMRNQETVSLKGVDTAIYDLYQKLKLTGIDIATLKNLVKYLQGQKDVTASDESERLETYKNHAVRWMLKRIRIAPSWNFTKGVPSVHFLVGSSGCGKSTTVWKMAANYRKVHKVNVLVVHLSEKYQIASANQKAFSEVLGIDTKVCNTLDELVSIRNTFEKYDLVLIDGNFALGVKNDRTPVYSRIRQEFPGAEFHCVLSSTLHRLNLDRNIRSFSGLGLNSLIFTKLDESWVYGEIFNLSDRWSLPLSFFGTGPSVPDDIERATKERVIERVFGI